MKTAAARILVVYYYRGRPLKAANRDHLYAFAGDARLETYHLNLAMRRIPRYFSRLKFDAIVFDPLFMSHRPDSPTFTRILDLAEPLKALAPVRIALPQDEFYLPHLQDAIDRLGITHLFSVSPPSEWPKLYPEAKGVVFHEVLTGYLDDRRLRAIERLAAERPARDIDIGYRAFAAPAWLGRHGRYKAEMGARVADRAKQVGGIVADISNRPGDTIFGDDWFRFLLRCKYTIGVEGGASLLDPDGRILRETTRYAAEHPGASYEEIEREVFPGMDDSVAFFMLSPRHLEAVATRTCQILIEGRFNDILQPHRHYIPLKRDYSNLDEVLEQVKKDDIRSEMVERAYQDIVASGIVSSRRFVDDVMRVSLGEDFAQRRAAEVSGARWAHLRCRMADRISLWRQIPGAKWFLFKARMKDRLPREWTRRLVALKRALVGGSAG
jgi:hypothetical protein